VPRKLAVTATVYVEPIQEARIVIHDGIVHVIVRVLRDETRVGQDRID